MCEEVFDIPKVFVAVIKSFEESQAFCTIFNSVLKAQNLSPKE